MTFNLVLNVVKKMRTFYPNYFTVVLNADFSELTRVFEVVLILIPVPYLD